MPRRTSRPWRRPLLSLVGIVLLAVVLFSLDLRLVGRVLAGTRLPLLSLGILLYVGLLAVRSWRWTELLAVQGIHEPFVQIAGGTVLGAFLGALTPGRFGDLARVEILRRRGQPLAPALASLVADRMTDLGFLVLVGGLALGSPLLRLRDRAIAAAAVALLLLAGVLALWLLVRGTLAPMVRWAAGRLVPAALTDRMATGLEGVGVALGRYTPGALLGPAFITLVFWGFYILCNVCLVRALGIEVPTGYLLLTLAAVGLLGLLPISIGGLGTREVTLIVLLGRLGIAPERAVAYGALEVFLLYIVTGVLALPFWWLSARVASPA